MKKALMGLLLGVVLVVNSLAFSVERPRCVGVYYWDNPPTQMFFRFDWIFVDIDGAKDRLAMYKRYKRAKVFGYISVGEIEPYREEFKNVKREWILGENKFWKSYIADVRNKEYQEYVLAQAEKAVRLGFDGFLLDTLDSYQLVVPKHEWQEHEKALVEIIREMKRRYPDKKIVTNRGFEIYNDVKDVIDGFMVEGLFSKLNTQTGRYEPTTIEERRRLLWLLEPIKHNHPVVVVDYVDLKRERWKAYRLAWKIKRLGFIPYISEKELNVVGVSPCTP